MTSLQGVASANTDTRKNRDLVQCSFADWAAGGENFFDILDENVVWTIVGSGPSARTFYGRKAFLEEAYGRIADCFSVGMKPTIVSLLAEGDEVVIHWNGSADMKDGQVYRNSYAWFFRMAHGKVVEATAFLDLPTYEAALAGNPLPTWGSTASTSEHTPAGGE